MKVDILPLGLMQSDSNNAVLGDTLATVANPNAPHKMNLTPSHAVLIDHPEAGWILFDTGMPDDPFQVWPKSILDQVICEKPKGTTMVEQLALVGIRPEDVKHVIISHMHMDHTGGDHLFAGTADFYVAKEEAAYACRMVLQSPDPADHGWYIHDDVLLPRKKLMYIDRDEELFPGVRVVTLPGHTPCVLGLVVHLEGGTLIFPSDAVADHRNYEGRLPGGVYDSRAYLESLRKVKDIERKFHGAVFFSHDAPQLKKMKLAPAFYE